MIIFSSYDQLFTASSPSFIHHSFHGIHNTGYVSPLSTRYSFTNCALEFALAKTGYIFNISLELVSYYDSFLYSDTFGDISHEEEFFFPLVSIISELRGDSDNNITRINDQLIYFCDFYSTSTMMSSSILSLIFVTVLL